MKTKLCNYFIILHNYKCYGIDQNRFRKSLQSSGKNVKNNYFKTTHLFLPTIQFVTSLNIYIVWTFASFW